MTWRQLSSLLLAVFLAGAAAIVLTLSGCEDRALIPQPDCGHELGVVPVRVVAMPTPCPKAECNCTGELIPGYYWKNDVEGGSCCSTSVQRGRTFFLGMCDIDHVYCKEVLK